LLGNTPTIYDNAFCDIREGKYINTPETAFLGILERGAKIGVF